MAGWGVPQPGCGEGCLHKGGGVEGSRLRGVVAGCYVPQPKCGVGCPRVAAGLEGGSGEGEEAGD